MSEKKSETINFEKKLNELEIIVSKLEAGNLSLDESIKLYKKGTELLKACNTILDNAEQQVSILRDGVIVSTDEFNLPED